VRSSYSSSPCSRCCAGVARQWEKSEFAFGDKIGVIDLEGVIIEPQTIAKQLKKFGEDDSIKAIVLHVNTPGGGVARRKRSTRR